jgi:hypothetical protein
VDLRLANLASCSDSISIYEAERHVSYNSGSRLRGCICYGNTFLEAFIEESAEARLYNVNFT